MLSLLILMCAIARYADECIQNKWYITGIINIDSQHISFFYPVSSGLQRRLVKHALLFYSKIVRCPWLFEGNLAKASIEAFAD